LTGAAVSTKWEIDKYAGNLNVPRERFFHIPFQMSWDQDDRRDTLSEIKVRNRTVLASGRASCDWPTLFAAAKGADWELIVVCGKKDLPKVQKLNSEGKAKVLCEISGWEHAQLLRAAAVYTLVLTEDEVSAGQVRLARAIDAGVPVVATEVRGLDGYLQHGVNALVVSAGDSTGLKRCIDDLVSDSTLRVRLRTSAYEFARSYTFAARVDDIASFTLGKR
jgi:glycosyltransferase involved in cell wall biosynthesis